MDAVSWFDDEEAERESDGFLAGLAVGLVTDNVDPDGLARVRVRLPWQAEGESSFWARLATPMAGGGRGIYFLPEVGDEVVVGAEQGDPAHLYVLGVVWNGQQAPPADNADGKNNERRIHSRLGHLLRFFDDEIEPQVELKLSDDKRLSFDKDGIVLEDGKKNTIKIDSSSGAIEISADSEIKISAGSISIESGGSMDIKASGTLTLKGATVQIN